MTMPPADLHHTGQKTSAWRSQASSMADREVVAVVADGDTVDKERRVLWRARMLCLLVPGIQRLLRLLLRTHKHRNGLQLLLIALGRQHRRNHCQHYHSHLRTLRPKLHLRLISTSTSQTRP